MQRANSLPLSATVDQFLLGINVLPWDSDAAQQYGQLRAKLHRQGRLLGSIDMLIAAHAISVGAILVSGDSAFRRIQGLKIEDWTKP